MKRVKLGVLVLVLVMMSGCFQKEVPKCSDDNVKNVLSEIYGNWSQNINNSDNPVLIMFKGAIPNSIVSFSSPRTLGFDKEIQLRTCKMDVTFDNNQSNTLQYTVQLDEEDNENFYVEISEDSLESIAQESMMKHMMQGLH